MKRDARGKKKTARPVMALLDLLGRRWALRVIWELRGERLNFRALQAASGVSPGVLNARLTELREAGIVEHRSDEGYGLLPEGAELLRRLMPLHDWAERWAKRRGAVRPMTGPTIDRTPRSPTAKPSNRKHGPY